MYRFALVTILFLFFAASLHAQDKKQQPVNLFKHSSDTVVVYSQAYKDSVARKRKQDAARRDTVIIIPAPKLVKRDTIRKQPAATQKSQQALPVPGGVPLTITISMRQAVVRTIYDLKISLIITNKGYRTQSFLFDSPRRASGGIWAASCTVYDGNGHSVLKFPYNNMPEKKTYTGRELEKFWYTLKPKEWLMKSYDVTSLVTFEDKYANSGRLPPGKYYLQLNIQGNPSNIVSFTVR